MAVKVRVTRREDGLFDVFVKRTDKRERHSRSAAGVPQEHLESVVGQLVGEMRGEATEAERGFSY